MILLQKLILIIYLDNCHIVMSKIIYKIKIYGEYQKKII